jgi:sortase A
VRRLVGLLLVVGGCILLVWQLVQPSVSAHRTEKAQAALAAEVPVGAERLTRTGPPVSRGVDEGAAWAALSIPRFGEGWRWIVVEGTGTEELESGPGHYVGTPQLGARGNTAIAAHRAGHGDPFLEFDTLRSGDVVVVQQGDVRWTYRLDVAPTIVMPEDTWVLDPSPTRRLTLTTCWPRYGSAKRMYVSGGLTEVAERNGAGPWETVWERRPGSM